MSPTIEISDALYEKLADLAVGFDTPENVIARLIADRATESSSDNKPDEFTSSSTTSDSRSLAEAVFQSFFRKAARPFGQNSGKWVGASDDENGVQWNINVHRETGDTYLGVNLEGMKYKKKNWPIANLLLAESEQAQLHTLSNIDAADEITVYLTRDAWQASARPPIKEQFIDGSGTSLSDLSLSLWSKMVQDGLECLNSEAAFKGRASMNVTLEKSGKTETREVSPHLSFKVRIWDQQPQTFEAALELISAAHNKLKPLHKWAKARTASHIGDEVAPESVKPDPNNSNWTIPRTWGVYEVEAEDGVQFRYGNHPVRQTELEREFGAVRMIALYPSKEAARERSTYEADG